ncbi:MAG: hypothetical protein ABI663_18855 [Chryseolinea sp.]
MALYPNLHPTFGRTVKTVELPVVKPVIETDVLTSIDPKTLEDSHVYVHCYVDDPEDEMLIRIWKTTFLIDRASGAKAGLIHAENITIAPLWTMIPGGSPFRFLLIFSSLPKSCTQFDFVEEISQPGGFFFTNIGRNESDVYHITIM